MSKNLVIVESPAKAKTINKYLGKDFVVEATVGHIKNLPKSKLGVDIENNFQPQFVTIRGKGDVIKKIKNLSSKSNHIYIATDPDREGEAIAQDIADVLNGKADKKISRVLFNEITKNGIKKGMESPREIDISLVNSQRARRIMDRLIGYKVSPFLWKSVINEYGSTLSAGRVQSVALRLICEREEEIEKFIPTEYWSISAIFETEKKEQFKAKLFSINDKEIKIPPKPVMSDEEWNNFLEKHLAISNKDEAERIFNQILKKENFFISNIVKKHTRRNPPPPFITSTLEAEASRVYRFRSKQTMSIAQKLYEGVDLGNEGTVGLITYIRTDSTRLSNEIVSEAKDYIKNIFGNEYVPEVPNNFEKKKSSNVQDAHEAIRPTSMKFTPEYVKKYLDPQSFKLYQLIWNRFLASQMKNAELETTIIEIKADEFLFKAYGQAILFNGFMQVYVEANEPIRTKEEKDEAKNEIIPAGLEKNQILFLNSLEKHQHFTKAPPRYTESSLIKELESNGIGRPSTYAFIVSTIVDRKYVKIEDRKLFPTPLGKKVNNILVENFPHIFDVAFTSKMEAELDEIAQGDKVYDEVLRDFYLPFSQALHKVENKIEKIYCDKCGAEMQIKIGKYGRYLACTNYPNCTNIKSIKDLIQENQEPEYTGEICPKCGNRLVYRDGKFGRFIGCEKYPDCDYIKNITLGITCPKCNQGEVVERKTKKRKSFYGCSRYPECDFISWYKPVNQVCPNCGSNYIEERYSVKKGKYLKCPNCKHEIKHDELIESTENIEN